MFTIKPGGAWKYSSLGFVPQNVDRILHQVRIWASWLHQALHPSATHNGPGQLPQGLPHTRGTGGLGLLQPLLLHQETDQQELLQVAGEEELGDEEEMNFEGHGFSSDIKTVLEYYLHHGILI